MNDFPVIHSLILLATIAAIIAGPIMAVKITRNSDRRNEKRTRKFEVLRGLMRTRRLKLDPEHVGALNLLQLEFYGIEPVMSLFRDYVQHLHLGLPPVGDAQQRHFKAQHELFIDLLHEVAKELDYQFDKLDLDRLSYVPIGWSDNEYLNRQNNLLLNEILQGDRGFPVTAMNPTPKSKFPPPPELPKDDNE